MLPDSSIHINLDQYNLWSNNWGVLHHAQDFLESVVDLKRNQILLRHNNSKITETSTQKNEEHNRESGKHSKMDILKKTYNYDYFIFK
jgi:hypothetical protein